MTQNLLFLPSVSGSKKGTRLTLPRMNCMVRADDFLYPDLEDFNFQYVHISK